MRERQGCRSASIQGDTGDMGERRFCRLRARRVDGLPARELYLPHSVSIVLGDSRRLPARRAPWGAFPPGLGFQHATEGK